MVYGTPEASAEEEPPVASSPTGGAYRHLSDEEQARMLQRLDALQDALRSEPGPEGLQQEVAEAKARAQDGHLLRQELPELVSLFRRYGID